MRQIYRLLVVAVALVLGAAVVVQPSSASGSYNTVVNRRSGLCLQPWQVPGTTIYDNAIPVAQAPCNGSAEQNWTRVFVRTAGDPRVCTGFGCPVAIQGYVDYFVNQLTGKCMDVTNGIRGNGVGIQQWACNGGTSEQWWHQSNVPFSSDFFVNSRTGGCLDVPGGRLVVSLMQQWTCNYSDAQYFTLP